jgi:hypothetical protein
MNKRPTSNWTPVGSITTRLAARLVARRDAEISAQLGGEPVEPGNQGGVGPIADASEARSRAAGRLNKGAASTRSQGGTREARGARPGGDSNVIDFAARVWGTGRAGTVPIRPCVKVRSPSHLPFSDENSEPLNISTARGSAYQRSQSGYVRRSICTCKACRTVVWSRCPNILPI